MDLLKALSGINAAQNKQQPPETKPAAAPVKDENGANEPAKQDSYNPMAEIIRRHENTVNRLRRGR